MDCVIVYVKLCKDVWLFRSKSGWVFYFRYIESFVIINWRNFKMESYYVWLLYWKKILEVKFLFFYFSFGVFINWCKINVLIVIFKLMDFGYCGDYGEFVWWFVVEGFRLKFVFV